jgi:hypothetical protein
MLYNAPKSIFKRPKTPSFCARNVLRAPASGAAARSFARSLSSRASVCGGAHGCPKTLSLCLSASLPLCLSVSLSWCVRACACACGSTQRIKTSTKARREPLCTMSSLRPTLSARACRRSGCRGRGEGEGSGSGLTTPLPLQHALGSMHRGCTLPVHAWGPSAPPVHAWSPSAPPAGTGGYAPVPPPSAGKC